MVIFLSSFLLSHQTFDFLSTSGVTSFIAYLLFIIAVIPVQFLHGAMKIITFQTTYMYCLNLLPYKNNRV
jgi:hypothetical protein